MKIGIISDTHDFLRPEAVSILSGVDAIFHAGDISSQGILDQLQAMAPVYAVRGNADKEWAEKLWSKEVPPAHYYGRADGGQRWLDCETDRNSASVPDSEDRSGRYKGSD